MSDPRLQRDVSIALGIAIGSVLFLMVVGILLSSYAAPAQALDMLSFMLPCPTAEDGCVTPHMVSYGDVITTWKSPGTQQFFVQALDTSWLHWLRYSWDDDWIYLDIDQWNGLGPQGATWYTPYTWADSRWAKRWMNAGDSFSVSTVMTRWYAECVTATEPWSYTITLEEYWPDVDCGGDAGRRDVVVLDYRYRVGSVDYSERNYYARGWGWVAFVEHDGGIQQGSYVFNLTGPYAGGSPVFLCPYPKDTQ